MNALASAVVHALAFLELSDDDVINPDSACSAMEMLAVDLQECTPAEKAALQQAINNELMIQKAKKAPQYVLEFYHDILINFDLVEEE